MATMTYDSAALKAAGQAGGTAVSRGKSGLFARIVAAIQESRMRQAEIEIRRARAIIGDRDTGFQDALLPFRGE